MVRRPLTGQPAFTGTGFDACTAPTQSDMDTWRADSPSARSASTSAAAPGPAPSPG
ncbi:hypothetical protein ACFSNO_32780 [Streptomyces cirratus]